MGKRAICHSVTIPRSATRDILTGTLSPFLRESELALHTPKLSHRANRSWTFLCPCLHTGGILNSTVSQWSRHFELISLQKWPADAEQRNPTLEKKSPTLCNVLLPRLRCGSAHWLTWEWNESGCNVHLRSIAVQKTHRIKYSTGNLLCNATYINNIFIKWYQALFLVHKGQIYSPGFS